MRSWSTRRWRKTNWGGEGELFFKCRNGAKHSKYIVEVGKPFYLMVICLFCNRYWSWF
jgi:hypothetical protein